MKPKATTLLVAAGFSCLLAGLVAPGRAEPVFKIKKTGPARERIDLVILGDGYTREDLEQGHFERDARQIADQIFAAEPYREYERLFNVYGIKVESAESGADQSDLGITRDTAFDAAYNCGGVGRLICINTARVLQVLQDSISAPNERDLALLLVNDSRYGGSGGSIPVASTHSAAVELALHEMGHSVALLGDEYVDPANCRGFTPSEPNLTTQQSRNRIKWAPWIDPATPIPTESTTPSTPGLYEGGGYCPTGIFRPTYDSKMRTLGRPFEQINREEHIKRFYNLVSPLGKPLPNTSAISLGPDETATFRVRVQRPKTKPVRVVWRLDGRKVGKGDLSGNGRVNRFRLDTSGLTQGIHRLQVRVKDRTPWVKQDRAGVLSDRHTWRVEVRPAGRPFAGKRQPSAASEAESRSKPSSQSDLDRLP